MQVKLVADVLRHTVPASLYTLVSNSTLYRSVPSKWSWLQRCSDTQYQRVSTLWYQPQPSIAVCHASEAADVLRHTVPASLYTLVSTSTLYRSVPCKWSWLQRCLDTQYQQVSTLWYPPQPSTIVCHASVAGCRGAQTHSTNKSLHSGIHFNPLSQCAMQVKLVAEVLRHTVPASLYTLVSTSTLYSSGPCKWRW
jgi:hypothetical protein